MGRLPRDGQAPGRDGAVKAALVTGGGQGIGRAIALRLARDGFAVAVADVNSAALAAVQQEIESAGGRALALPADLTLVPEIRQAVQRAAAGLGGLDVLVNNAGRLVTKPFLDVAEGDWDALLGLNLKTVFFAMQAAAQAMIAAGIHGRIVSISSIAGRGGRADQAPYAAAKAGIISLTRSAALAFAPHGITVNAVCPGVVDTPMTRQIHEERGQALGIAAEESLARMLSRVPLGRIETPDDVAGAVSFLCSPDAGYITGQALNVDGGMEMD
jgi:meso-butanediol dehydrogenase/(S,S)-butanediol dehydrogenase/diacetyl reductase